LARVGGVSGGDRVQNLADAALEYEVPETPPGHRFRATSLTEPFGAVATGMSVYELEPGNASWPYHFEVNEEEWLIVIAGEVTLRTPEGESLLRAGDVVCFPAGVTGAHAVRNHTDAPARFAMPSTEARYGGATVYPDSGKVSVGGPGFRHRGWLGEPVEYWEGEP
jgi:uncharacterized cupin superfamily protein